MSSLLSRARSMNLNICGRNTHTVCLLKAETNHYFHFSTIKNAIDHMHTLHFRCCVLDSVHIHTLARACVTSYGSVRMRDEFRTVFPVFQYSAFPFPPITTHSIIPLSSACHSVGSDVDAHFFRFWILFFRHLLPLTVIDADTKSNAAFYNRTIRTTATTSSTNYASVASYLSLSLSLSVCRSCQSNRLCDIVESSNWRAHTHTRINVRMRITTECQAHKRL